MEVKEALVPYEEPKLDLKKPAYAVGCVANFILLVMISTDRKTVHRKLTWALLFLTALLCIPYVLTVRSLPLTVTFALYPKIWLIALLVDHLTPTSSKEDTETSGPPGAASTLKIDAAHTGAQGSFVSEKTAEEASDGWT